MTNVVLKLLCYCIKIASHQEQVRLGASDCLPGLNHAKHWIGSTGAKIEEETRGVFVRILSSLNVHRPVAAPCEGSNNPFAASTVAREKGRVSPT